MHNREPELIAGFNIDPAHEQMPLFEQQLVKDVWRDKYKYQLEGIPQHTFQRVARGIYANDSADEMNAAYTAMSKGLWIPAGRIMAGAGTSKHVTLMNCYVMGTIDDSMEGIFEELKKSSLTLRMGGGIGMDFSTLRPRGAALKRLGYGAMSSGAVSFMDNWDAMCRSIMSAGARRGAMMGTLADWHPDLIEFIEAKRQKGRLTNFNVSIKVSDALMQAVAEDATWALYFDVPPAVDPILYTFDNEEGTQYVYKEVRARDLWNQITRLTYEFSEPGVIFMDRVNEMNNLSYCEQIECTNPCGEQPLPPYGTCNLGAVNLSRMVKHPFTPHASFDMELLQDTVIVGTRFLDNVIEATEYPLPEQKQEEISKRRVGLGLTGLANALAQLGIRYGSDKAVKWVADVQKEIANQAYMTSALLAAERGAFPLYDASKYQLAPFVQKLDANVRDAIHVHGIRNGVLLTVAPTGTTSIAFGGNCSSGIEPVFAHHMTRKVLQADGTHAKYTSYDYGYLLYHKVMGIDIEAPKKLPDYMATAMELSVDDHLYMQCAVQEWTDASISKTINVPENTSFEDFQKVYTRAYGLGAKGCTTYRPSDVRGSVLEVANAPNTSEAPNTVSALVNPDMSKLAERPEILEGKTVKIKWPTLDNAFYLTVNYLNGKPFEVFISSKDEQFDEWTKALCLMISAILRRGGDFSFIHQELQQVKSANNQTFMGKKHFKSIVAYMGHKLEELFHGGVEVGVVSSAPTPELLVRELPPGVHGGWNTCPKCHEPTLIRQEGCDRCTSCGYSKCG
jgi:ribonucleoside-diphosphate reductase alpha chain